MVLLFIAQCERYWVARQAAVISIGVHASLLILGGLGIVMVVKYGLIFGGYFNV